MSLRAVRHHWPALKTVVVIGSVESLPQAGRFATLIGRYVARVPWGQSPRVLAFGRDADNLGKLYDPLLEGQGVSGWDFEEFDDLSAGMARCSGSWAGCSARSTSSSTSPAGRR